jgi:hypothetical protein
MRQANASAQPFTQTQIGLYQRRPCSIRNEAAAVAVCLSLNGALPSKLIQGEVMPKKPPIEADLDPVGTRHSRPGAKIADAAIAASKRPRKRAATSATAAPSRPGATAAARAVAATRGKATRK